MSETLISREKLLESMRETYQYLLNLCNDLPAESADYLKDRLRGELDMSLEMILRVKQQPTVYPDKEVHDDD